ncbi:ion channel protein [Microbacterium sp. SLBN-146]|uniref:ion channel protein n=1 Tax=Microbacterium sp. SLBN-146 TaxID=2768457 RepID=UPI001153A36A|nr:ion channel protein [Microbacterium sp. SLBN-146]TQJ32014.1 H+/Cl- antiporter ClcA [Microbacterium sp. SLBN-146]
MPDQEPLGSLSVRTLLVMSLPALMIGVLSALVLWGLERIAEVLQTGLWETAPDALGIPQDSPWLIVAVLTLTGAAVGLVVRFVPGHGGQDSATTELDSPPPPIRAVPSVALAAVLGLAGGVSLGPENPIIAINCAIAVALCARFVRAVPTNVAVLLASAATIGALFGTPVAAALVLTGTVAAVRGGGSLWDKLFLPVAAAAAGAITMRMLGSPALAFDVPAYTGPNAIDLLSGFAIAAVSAGLGIAAAWALPRVHRLFHSLRNPILFTTLGGLVLGLLGVIGGPLTLFKGLEETGELIAHPEDYSAGQLALFAGIKLIALVVAASAGFRGGRIFPAVFIGVAVGLCAHALFPSVPLGLAIACGGMGIVLLATRDGWIALFLGVALTGDIGLLPILCVIVLPTWLLVTRAPLLEVRAPGSPGAAADS